LRRQLKPGFMGIVQLLLLLLRRAAVVVVDLPQLWGRRLDLH